MVSVPQQAASQTRNAEHAGCITSDHNVRYDAQILFPQVMQHAVSRSSEVGNQITRLHVSDMQDQPPQFRPRRGIDRRGRWGRLSAPCSGRERCRVASVPRNAISGTRGLEACHDLQSVPWEALMEYEHAGVHSTDAMLPVWLMIRAVCE